MNICYDDDKKYELIIIYVAPKALAPVLKWGHSPPTVGVIGVRAPLLIS